ncbi:Endonuclease/exonuclease/phosphatase [Russula compacta]|nr:Endonuclease/exonuclease/phosphatase [Russula compacta]
MFPQPGTFIPTPEQLALREARRLKKQSATTNTGVAPPVNNEKGQIIARPWLTVPGNFSNAVRPVKIMTWNLLAQCLVRRELFPNSDCLKAAQREHMAFKEILSADADILCLQEVDRLGKLIPVLEEAKYGHVYVAGPGKKHGCLIGFRKDSLKIRNQFVLYYDDIDLRLDGAELSRRGLSFRTKNVANVVALEKAGQPGEGYVVATTHLFWHPSYAYERARQTGILLREVVKYRENSGLLSWPCFLTGGKSHRFISDFNFSPMEPGYALLVGDMLTPAQEKLLERSRVVHVSVDPSVLLTNPAATDDDEDGGAPTHPDLTITNARGALPDDGLLTSSELMELFAVVSSRPRSLYDEGQRRLEKISADSVLRCGERMGLPPHQRGAYEPEWTSYTHYWQSVLDYIWVIDPPDRRASVVRLLQPHTTENLQPGLPRKGISGSDHVSLAAEVQWDSID